MGRIIFSASILAVSMNVLGMPVSLGVSNLGLAVSSSNGVASLPVMVHNNVSHGSGIVSDIEWANSDNVVDSSDFFSSYIGDAGDLASPEIPFNKGSLPLFSSSVFQNCDKDSLANKFRRITSNKKVKDIFIDKIVRDIKQKLILTRESISRILGKLRLSKGNVIEKDNCDDVEFANAVKNNFHVKPKENLNEFFKKSDRLMKKSLSENIYRDGLFNAYTEQIIERDVRQPVIIDDEPLDIKISKDDASRVRNLFDIHKKIRKIRRTYKQVSWFFFVVSNPKRSLRKLCSKLQEIQFVVSNPKRSFNKLCNKLQKMRKITTVVSGFYIASFSTAVKSFLKR